MLPSSCYAVLENFVKLQQHKLLDNNSEKSTGKVNKTLEWAKVYSGGAEAPLSNNEWFPLSQKRQMSVTHM